MKHLTNNESLLANSLHLVRRDKNILFFSRMFLFLVLFYIICCPEVAAQRILDVTHPDYGAVGNGENHPYPQDNLTHIQAALDDADPDDTVYFPAGIYRVSGTLFVPSGVRIQGVGSQSNCQIRLTTTNKPLFELQNSQNVSFKDISLYSMANGYPRQTPAQTALIRNENTTGISLKSSGYYEGQGIRNIQIENVHIVQFTYGISARSTVEDIDMLIKDVKIRNYYSEGNEYALHTNTRGADNWDVQNLNVFPMFDKQNGIFLEKSGKMRFLQLSCAGVRIKPDRSNPEYLAGSVPGICAVLWGNGDTYFKQMHVEGPRLGFCVGSDCKQQNPSYKGQNASVLTVENSGAFGDFHRNTNLVSINNGFWLDHAGSPRFKFLGQGQNSWLMSCGDVWVSYLAHVQETTVNLPQTDPNNAFPGLLTPIYPCYRYYEKTVIPVIDKGFLPDPSVRQGVEVNVASFGANGADGQPDTVAFKNALAAARAAVNPNASYVPIKRIFVPEGTFDITETLILQPGETIVGVPPPANTSPASVIRLSGSNLSLFKIYNALGTDFRGITLRNLTLTSMSKIGTAGIDMENHDPQEKGAATDFQFQNLEFSGFAAGIAVHPNCGPNIQLCSDIDNFYDPMFDSVSVKKVKFVNNKAAILLHSENASNWNFEDITVDLPDNSDGIVINGTGLLSIRDMTCTGTETGLNSVCVAVQKQNNLSIYNLSASNVTNALVARWQSGFKLFPIIVRNSDLRAGVYFEGKVNLTSVNNIYPARFETSFSSKVVKFQEYRPNVDNTLTYGGLSNIFSCDDTFTDGSVTQTAWKYEYTGIHSNVPYGSLPNEIKYCN